MTDKELCTLFVIIRYERKIKTPMLIINRAQDIHMGIYTSLGTITWFRKTLSCAAKWKCLILIEGILRIKETAHIFSFFSLLFLSFLRRAFQFLSSFFLSFTNFPTSTNMNTNLPSSAYLPLKYLFYLVMFTFLKQKCKNSMHVCFFFCFFSPIIILIKQSSSCCYS